MLSNFVIYDNGKTNCKEQFNCHCYKFDSDIITILSSNYGMCIVMNLFLSIILGHCLLLDIPLIALPCALYLLEVFQWFKYIYTTRSNRGPRTTFQKCSTSSPHIVSCVSFHSKHSVYFVS